MNKTQISSIFLCLTFACSATQRESLNNSLPPNPYNGDAAISYNVDLTPYDVVLPPIPEVRLDFSDSGALITPLSVDARAPFNGVLFNSEAVARLEVEFRGIQTRCNIDRQADINTISARAVRDINSLQNIFSTEYQAFNILLRGRDDEIMRLRRIAERERSVQNNVISSILFFGAGFLVGAGIAATTVFFLTR